VGTDQPARSEVLLDRDAELAALDGLIGSASGGEGRILVVEGPAGIGKTRLLEVARGRALASHTQLLTARCSEFEQDFSFSVVRQLFEPALAAVSQTERMELFSGAAGAAQAVMDPSAAPAEYMPATPPASVVHGLYWLCANLTSRGPALLSIDDAHWADPASLRWLTYLARRLAGLPVLVTMTVRPVGEGHAPALLMLVGDECTHVMRLGPLSEEAVAEVLTALLPVEPDAVFIWACHRATGGNPFLVRALAASLAMEGIAPTRANAERVGRFGPASVSMHVQTRLARLSSTARSLARAVAVLEAGVEWQHAAELAGLEERALAAAADELARADILRTAETLEFIHPIVRNAIYSSIPSGDRAYAHARAARMLAENGVRADRIAPHLLVTHPQGDPWVVDLLRDAARRATGEGAPEVSATYLRRALEESPAAVLRPRVLLELGAAEARAGEPVAVGHLEEALETSEDRHASGVAALELGLALVAHGRLSEAARVFTRGIELVEAVDRELALRLEAELLAAARLDHSIVSLANERLAQHGERPAGDTPSERLLLGVMAMDAALVGRPSERVAALAERALRDGTAATRHPAISPPLNQAAYALVVVGGLDEAQAFYDHALQDARRKGSVIGFAVASCWRSHLAYRRGRIDDAEADARSALAIVQEQRWVLGLPAAVAFLVEALVERGEHDAAWRVLEGVVDEEHARRSGLFDLLLYSRARLHMACCRPREALADLESCGRGQDALGVRNPAVIPWRSAAAEAYANLGDLDRTRRLAGEDLELARASGSAWATGIALRAAASAERGLAAVRRLEEGINVLAASPHRLELARAHVDLGAALRRGGQRAAARDPLREGLDLAHRCGAKALADRARVELVATGARPRRPQRTGVDALTPSERRVADMATQGLTNKEIAQALFVTQKTVEVHLRSTYRKLDIRSRAELPSQLLAPQAGATVH
jgi:DNA-binding CsgD family transcriptional regulator